MLILVSYTCIRSILFFFITRWCEVFTGGLPSSHHSEDAAAIGGYCEGDGSLFPNTKRGLMLLKLSDVLIYKKRATYIEPHEEKCCSKWSIFNAKMYRERKQRLCLREYIHLT